MTALEIILTSIGIFIAIVLPIYLYKKNRNDSIVKEKKSIINEVVGKYFELVDSFKDSGISALIKAGMLKLDDEKQAEQVIITIKNERPQNHKLGLDIEELKQHDLGLLEFLRIVEKEPRPWTWNIDEFIKTKIKNKNN